MIHKNDSSKNGSKNVRQSVRHFHQDGFSGQLFTNTQIKADKYRFLYWCHEIFLITEFKSEIRDPRTGPRSKRCVDSCPRPSLQSYDWLESIRLKLINLETKELVTIDSKNLFESFHKKEQMMNWSFIQNRNLFSRIT